MLNFKSLTFILAMFVFSAGMARAANFKVYSDPQTGMPRCVTEGFKDTLIVWDDGNPYQKDVKICRIDSTEIFGCSDWKKWTNYSDVPFHCFVLKESDLPRLGWPEDVQVGILQLMRGSNKFHPLSAKEYLEWHPIEKWTTELNQQLVSRFGMGFVSEIYKEWIELDSNNFAFKKNIISRMKEASQGTGPDVSVRFKNTILLYAPGLGHAVGPDNPLVEFMKKMGVEVKIFDTLSRGNLIQNRDIILKELRIQIRSGKKIVLASESKGTSELLGALLLLLGSRSEDSSLAHDSILGIVTFSANAQGSFLADTFENSIAKPIAWAIAGLLKWFHEDKTDILIGIHNCATRVIEKFYRESLASSRLDRVEFPDHWLFLEVSGALMGSGMSSNGTVRKVQDVISFLLPNSTGANDGLIEFPNTFLPDAWAARQRRVVVQGSHFLVDGNFDNEFEFADPKNLGFIVSGLLNGFMDGVDGIVK